MTQKEIDALTCLRECDRFLARRFFLTFPLRQKIAACITALTAESPAPDAVDWRTVEIGTKFWAFKREYTLKKITVQKEGVLLLGENDAVLDCFHTDHCSLTPPVPPLPPLPEGWLRHDDRKYFSFRKASGHCEVIDASAVKTILNNTDVFAAHLAHADTLMGGGA